MLVGCVQCTRLKEIPEEVYDIVEDMLWYSETLDYKPQSAFICEDCVNRNRQRQLTEVLNRMGLQLL